MSNFSVRLGLIAVALAGLAAADAAMAAGQQKGGAPAPAARGGAPAAHFSAPAAHFSAPAAHFSAPAAHFSRPSGGPVRSFAHPVFRGNAGHPAFHGNFARSAHPVFRGQPHNIAHTRPTFRGTTPHALTTNNRGNELRNNRVSKLDELRNARHATELNKRAIESSHAIRNALNTRQVKEALHNRNELRDPRTRSMIAANVARAGWHHHDHDFDHGWWRHRHGGFGWVGPLFWPFAYYDFYDYALWGYGYDDSFWDYGYNDIYAGLFAPYGYDDLAGYAPQYAYAGPSRGRYRTASAPPASPASQLGQMCGDDTRDIAGLPIDQIQQQLQLNGEERAELDDLANASAKAGQIIKAACPRDIALTAPGRLDAMQDRIQAMIQAVRVVQPPLSRFYESLTDEQKARLNALGQNQNRNRQATGSLALNCGTQTGVMDWPTSEIERSVHPTGAQQARADALKAAADKASEMLQASCPSDNTTLTPPARLAAVGKRLETMLQAVRSVHSALNDFYNSLNDEQKAQFDAIGPQRAARG